MATLKIMRAQLRADVAQHERVEALDVEPGDGWFVTLKTGWRYAGDPMAPVHCFGAPTLTEAMREVRAALPCDCEQCKAEG